MLFFQNFIEHLGFVHSVILARRKSVRAERTTITDTEFSSLILAQCTAKRDREREWETSIRNVKRVLAQ